LKSPDRGRYNPRRFANPGDFVLRLLLALTLMFTAVQTAAIFGQTPTLPRAVARYTAIYSDSVATTGPALGAGFVLESSGSLSANPSEVISGKSSIVGSYSGSGSYTTYVRTDPAVIPLLPNHAYRIVFQYKILTAANNSFGFEVLFLSQTALTQGSFLPSVTFNGAAGTTGTATLANVLGSFTDYQVRWNIAGTGAVSIDNIQILDGATGSVVATENAETTSITVGAGLQVRNGASVTTDPAIVLQGKGSIRLTNYGEVATVPAAVQLVGSATYIVEFRYRILNYGSSDTPLQVRFQPTDNPSPSAAVLGQGMLKNAPATGKFSSGAMMAGAGSYVLIISAGPGSDIVIDDLVIFRQEVLQSGRLPASWSRLSSLPHPRIGMVMVSSTRDQAQAGGLAEGPPFRITQDQVESRLAFADVIVPRPINDQTQFPDSIRRLRQLNPGAVILPFRGSYEQNVVPCQCPASNVDLDYEFQQGLADEWYLRDSKGNYVVWDWGPSQHLMNISPFSPVVKGETFTSYLLKWLQQKIFSSGLWDGVYFDGIMEGTNLTQMPNASDPALFDVDYNRNQVRDETIPMVAEMARNASISMLKDLQSSQTSPQLVMIDNGNMAPVRVAPYVNGFQFECFDWGWDQRISALFPGSDPNQAGLSQAGWRMELDNYRTAQAKVREPRINLVLGCGPAFLSSGTSSATPTAADLQEHRLMLGTTLLDDGFYGFALHDAFSAPLWMDEYSVDSKGVAVEDRAQKGYLGRAISDAVELTGSKSVIFEENFNRTDLPASFTSNAPGSSSVSISQAAGEVIEGSGSLLLSNPDHTKRGFTIVNINPSTFQFVPGTTYLLTFDWRIVETIDFAFGASIRRDDSNQVLENYGHPGLGQLPGDGGTAYVPFLVTESGPWTVSFSMNGAGKVAVDNVRISQGGVGPWRRDFENGFVLLNPLFQPHTFSAAELAGSLNRTGIRRIKGTQAPEINNGQPVNGDFTLGPFDAIILLADRIAAPAAPSTSLAYGVSNGALSVTTDGSAPSLKTGFAIIDPDVSDKAPSGLAIFGNTQNGILLSEAGVPANAPVRSARIYAEVAGPVNTGVAIANANSEPAVLSFFFTDSQGRNFGTGTTVIPAHGQLSAFLDQTPFNGGLNISGTFTVASSVPVGIIALRSLNNERGDFLMTTLPVSPIAASDEPIVFPHFADGAGWSSQVVLVNPTDQLLTGTLDFVGQGSATSSPPSIRVSIAGQSGSTFNYSLSPRSSQVFRTSGLPETLQAGSIQVTPGNGSRMPDGVVIFSQKKEGVTVSEAGVSASRANTAFRMYAEMSDDGLIQTGVAVVNTSTEAANFRFELVTLAGTQLASSGTIRLAPRSKFAGFVNQIPGLEKISIPFRGVLRISSDVSFAVTGIRGHYNSRGDFLITTTPPLAETAPQESSTIIPHLAFGSGFSTQIILMNPSDAEISRGFLRFVSPDGQGLPIVLR
jgi:hypothetical protein